MRTIRCDYLISVKVSMIWQKDVLVNVAKLLQRVTCTFFFFFFRCRNFLKWNIFLLSLEKFCLTSAYLEIYISFDSEIILSYSTQ